MTAPDPWHGLATAMEEFEKRLAAIENRLANKSYAIEIVGSLDSNPDLAPGGYITLERSDGRSLWRQRFVSRGVQCYGERIVYMLEPVKDA